MKRRSRPPLPQDPSHAIARARERYGLELTANDLRDIAARIERGRFEHVRPLVTQPDGRVGLLVMWSGRWVKLVWHPRAREVVTFLPLAAQWTEDGVPLLPGATYTLAEQERLEWQAMLRELPALARRLG